MLDSVVNQGIDQFKCRIEGELIGKNENNLNVLTGQNVVKTKISPLGSISHLVERHSNTIDLAGNHDFA